jgi:hypothetical protein
MPLSTTMTFQVWPATCDDDDPKLRVTFHCRYLNGLQSIELAETLRRTEPPRSGDGSVGSGGAGGDGGDDARQAAMYAALAMFVVRITNMPDGPVETPTVEQLRELLTPIEADDLLTRAFRANVPDTYRKKNSESPSDGSTSPPASDRESDAPGAEDRAPTSESRSSCAAPVAEATDAMNAASPAASTLKDASTR